MASSMEEVAQKRAGQDDTAISWKTIFICLYPCFGGILFGYDSGYINGALNIDQFKHDYGTPGHAVEVAAPGGYLYSDAQKSLIVSILSAGTFIGALTAGYFADRLGRRLTIQIGCIIYTIGVILQMAVTSVAFLAAGRGIAGVGVGFVSATVIMYVSEIAPKKIRGTLVSCYQFSITIGLLLAAAVAYATKDLVNSSAYRILIGLQFLWALTLGGGLLLLPESPRWYVMKARKEKAEKSLAKIRSLDVNDPFVKQEYADLVDSHRKDVGDGEGGWIECFHGGLKGGSILRRTLLGMTIQMMQQLTGVNFIFYFGTTFFKQVGITIPFKVSIITATVNVVSTPISFWTIERFGRRAILLGGAIGMGISQLIVAIVGIVTSHTASDTFASQPSSTSDSSKVLIAFVCIFIFFFASTWGPCVWAVTGEIFPVRVRSKGIALSTASNWLWNFVIAFCTPYLVDQDQADLGAKVFFIWGGTCILCGLFAYFFVYETKGLSLEEVDRMMVEITPRKSKKWDSGGRVNDEETAQNSGSSRRGFLLWRKNSSKSPVRQTARPTVRPVASEDSNRA